MTLDLLVKGQAGIYRLRRSTCLLMATSRVPPIRGHRVEFILEAKEKIFAAQLEHAAVAHALSSLHTWNDRRAW